MFVALSSFVSLRCASQSCVGTRSGSLLGLAGPADIAGQDRSV